MDPNQRSMMYHPTLEELAELKEQIVRSARIEKSKVIPDSVDI